MKRHCFESRASSSVYVFLDCDKSYGQISFLGNLIVFSESRDCYRRADCTPRYTDPTFAFLLSSSEIRGGYRILGYISLKYILFVEMICNGLLQFFLS